MTSFQLAVNLFTETAGSICHRPLIRVPPHLLERLSSSPPLSSPDFKSKHSLSSPPPRPAATSSTPPRNHVLLFSPCPTAASSPRPLLIPTRWHADTRARARRCGVATISASVAARGHARHGSPSAAVRRHVREDTAVQRVKDVAAG